MSSHCRISATASRGKIWTLLVLLAVILPGCKATKNVDLLESFNERFKLEGKAEYKDVFPDTPYAKRVIDRFHLQKLACDAIQKMRIACRWEALKG